MKVGQDVCLDDISDEFENGSHGVVRMFVWMISRMSSKMGHVGSKTRSPGQILGKPCVRSRGHIFSRILMKVGQDVCLDDISDEFENGSRGVKN